MHDSFLLIAPPYLGLRKLISIRENNEVIQSFDPCYSVLYTNELY